MKTNFQKLKLNRKTSANSSSNRQIEIQTDAKVDKLSELRAKIQKERDIMRTSGKRFNKGASDGKSVGTGSIAQGLYRLPKKEEIKFKKGEQRVAELIIGQEKQSVKKQEKPVVRETVDLTELIVETQQLSLSGSRLFQKELVQQKHRNQEVTTFLDQLGLGQYSQGLINLGYDELDVLVEVSCEELNFLMMRAGHQRILTDALKAYRVKNGMQEQSKTITSVTQSAFFKAKAKNQAPKLQKTETYESNTRPKSAFTIASTTPTNNSGLFSNSSAVKPNPSFFIGIGGGQWSIDSMVRRACSSCYTVLPGSDLVQQQGCYYCWPCKLKSDDPLGVMMNKSMIQDYKL